MLWHPAGFPTPTLTFLRFDGSGSNNRKWTRFPRRLATSCDCLSKATCGETVTPPTLGWQARSLKRSPDAGEPWCSVMLCQQLWLKQRIGCHRVCSKLHVFAKALAIYIDTSIRRVSNWDIWRYSGPYFLQLFCITPKTVSGVKPG